MIRQKTPEIKLFYEHEEIYRPPRTNFYIQLNQVVGSWAKLCKPLDKAFSANRNGRPTDPVVFLKIFLIGYFENIVFDTELAERIGDSLAIREFLGYGPTERTPDHATLSLARKRFAKDDLLQEVFDAVLKLCLEQGLADGKVVAADSTLLKANASLSSLRSQEGTTLREHMDKLREQGKKPTLSNEDFQSKTDPEARVTTKPSAPVNMYYKVTHVTDSKSQVLLAVDTSCADTSESLAVRVPLQQAKDRLDQGQKKLETVVADAGYDDSSFHEFVETQIQALPLTNYQTSSSKPDGFAKTDFEYDQAKDQFTCPNGKVLHYQRKEGPNLIYLALEQDCLNCPDRKQCLGKRKRRRQLKRLVTSEARERNIQRCHTDEGRRLLKQRKHIVEPPFGHIKRYGGISHLNCRSLKRVQAKMLAAGIAWNLLKLVKNAGNSLDLRRFRHLLDLTLQLPRSSWVTS
jgi:transposase